MLDFCIAIILGLGYGVIVVMIFMALIIVCLMIQHLITGKVFRKQ
jgi:hypothetical protein